MSGSGGDWSNATPRIFARVPLDAGAEVATEAHYLGHVLRRREGDPVRLFDGAHGEWGARIARLGKREAVLRAELRLRAQVAEPDFWLAVAPLRRDLTELVVQKATEIGVSEIRFVRTARTQPFRLNMARLMATAVEAAEQSERLSVPALREAVDLAAFLAAWPATRVLAVAMERSQHTGTVAPGGVLIGPEGGFTPAERDMLQGRFVSLGDRVLRAETAAIVAAARFILF